MTSIADETGSMHLGVIKRYAENAGCMPAFQISYDRSTPTVPNLRG